MSLKDCAESVASSDSEGVEKEYDLDDSHFQMLESVVSWDVSRVCKWVDDIGFPIDCGYSKKFSLGAVHGPLLIKLDAELLEDIGVTRKVHIHRFLTDIDALKKSQTGYEKEKKTRAKSPVVITPKAIVRRDQQTELAQKLLQKYDLLSSNQERLLNSMRQLQNRFETMPYWNRVRMVEKLGLADTESISRHFEDMEDGALYYPSIYVNCEKQDHIIIGNYTCYGRLYGKPFYVKNCKTKKLLLYYRSDLDKKRWRFTRTNKHSLADFCEKRKYQARTKDSCDHPAAHLIPKDTEWAVWDGRTDHNWWVTTEISDNQPFLPHWVKNTHYGVMLKMDLIRLCTSFIFVPDDFQDP